MAETEGVSKVSAPTRPPMITLPPRVSSFETLLTGLSPGPMTLVSNFFSEQYPETDCRSFSQLLAGAMASPVAQPIPTDNNCTKEVGCGDGSEKNLGFKQNRPMNLVVAHSPMFLIPSGLSPSGLLSSGFFSPAQSPFGMSHQQALAHVTAQAALSQSYYNIQAEYPPPSLAASVDSPEQEQQQMPTVTSDLEDSQMESPDVSHSDKKLPPASDKPNNDGYNWRKYGQKQVKASDYPRSYYKCTHISCPVKKKVGRSPDGQIGDIIYKGQHNHEPPQPNKRAKEAADLSKTRNSQARPEHSVQSQSETSRSLEEFVPSQVELPVGNNQVSTLVVDLEERDNAEKRLHDCGYDEPNSKRSNTEPGSLELTSSHKMVTEPKIVVQTRSEVDLLDDGYKWRKYGQKVVKGNTNPRSYYKCTYMGCNVRKHVERASSDPKAVITTYEGKHNHDIPIGRHRSYNSTNSGEGHVKPEKKPSRHKDMNFGKDQRSVLLQLKEEQITA